MDWKQSTLFLLSESWYLNKSYSCFSVTMTLITPSKVLIDCFPPVAARMTNEIDLVSLIRVLINQRCQKLPLVLTYLVHRTQIPAWTQVSFIAPWDSVKKNNFTCRQMLDLKTTQAVFWVGTRWSKRCRKFWRIGIFVVQIFHKLTLMLTYLHFQ